MARRFTRICLTERWPMPIITNEHYRNLPENNLPLTFKVHRMEKEINVPGNELQNTTELTQIDGVSSNTEKMLWHSPKLRVLQVSQETAVQCFSDCNI